MKENETINIENAQNDNNNNILNTDKLDPRVEFDWRINNYDWSWKLQDGEYVS